MDTNLLKLFAGSMITNMTEMSKASRTQLLNYVEEAEEYQVKAFLLDGEIMKEPKDVVCEEIVDQRYFASDLPEKIKEFEDYWTNITS